MDVSATVLRSRQPLSGPGWDGQGVAAFDGSLEVLSLLLSWADRKDPQETSQGGRSRARSILRKVRVTLAASQPVDRR